MSKPWNPGRESADVLLVPLVEVLEFLVTHPGTEPDEVKLLLSKTKAEPLPFGARATSVTMEEWLDHDPEPNFRRYSEYLFLRAFRYGIEQGRRMAIQRLSDGGAVGFRDDTQGQ